MITFEFHQSIFMRQTICLLLMVAATAIAATSSYAEVSVTFGIYASEKPTEMVIQFRPVLNLMEKELSKKLNDNVKIKIKISKEYEDGITQIVDGNVDISRLGPASFVTATQKNPALTLLALEGKKGKKVFNGVICVRAESNITSVEQLRGKSFAFGDSLSTIGRYLSQEY
ncbi:MAG: PhnD/SsuA/transferrin family substrate-binding protein, partial [Bdellovibrionales bacterium]|nr:PhnD/SsuA/transferrin family substrate-binding protein [Bdellovibrionales bacterium]